MNCKYRVIVSIDGGGKKGLIPLRFLSFLEERLNEFSPKTHISSWVDVYSGTSTSAIIAAALALSQKGKMHKPSDMVDLYLKRGHHFFDSQRARKSVHPLNYVLEHFYGDLTLAHIRKHFLFVSYDLDADEPFLFTDSQLHVQNIPISRMMQACCASPGMMEAIMIGNKRLADGMLTTKNPSHLAYQYAKVFYPDDPIVLLSIGTGKGILPTIEDLQAEEQHQKMLNTAKTDQRLLYFRYDPYIESMDPTMQQLIDATDVYIRESESSIDRLLHLMEIKAGRLL
jgi:uncharacterized protein